MMSLLPFWPGRKTERNTRENESDRLIDMKNRSSVALHIDGPEFEFQQTPK